MQAKAISDYHVCWAVRQARTYADCRWPYEILADHTGACEKVCYRAMERAAKRGLIEYGVSLRSGWLTAKGHHLLAEGKPW